MANTTRGAEALKSLVTPPRVNAAEIAARCEVSTQAVSSWMQGRMLPSPARMRILQDEYGIPMEAWTEDSAPEADSEPHTAAE